MLDPGTDIAAEQRRHELLNEVERDRLAIQAREYAHRNPQPSLHPTNPGPPWLRLGLVAALRSKFAPNQT